MKEISNFYSFETKFLRSAFTALVQTDDKNVLCDPGLLTGDYRNISLPLIFRHESGSKFCDLMDMGGLIYLISERTRSLFVSSGLSGWKTFAVKVYDKSGNLVDGYHGFSVTGKCGPISYDMTRYVDKQHVPNGPITRYFKGILIGIDQWDGSNFFLPQDNTGIIVTQKVADIVNKNKLTNIDLINLKDIEAPEYSLKIRGIT